MPEACACQALHPLSLCVRVYGPPPPLLRGLFLVAVAMRKGLTFEWKKSALFWDIRFIEGWEMLLVDDEQRVAVCAEAIFFVDSHLVGVHHLFVATEGT